MKLGARMEFCDAMEKRIFKKKKNFSQTVVRSCVSLNWPYIKSIVSDISESYYSLFQLPGCVRVPTEQ